MESGCIDDAMIRVCECVCVCMCVCTQEKANFHNREYEIRKVTKTELEDPLARAVCPSSQPASWLNS